VDVGATAQLSVTLTPSNATTKCTFASADASIATVNASTGLVKGIKYGSTTVKAFFVSADGATVIEDSITVTVDPVKVTKINISATKKTMTPGSTLQLKATVEPSNASNADVTWKITKGEEYATVSATGLVTAGPAADREFEVTATAKDGSGITRTIKIPIVLS
jgi:uncharacterized protein YjdB